MFDLTPHPERTILVAVGLKSDQLTHLEINLDELAQLAESAGAFVVGTVQQRMERITPATYIGTGKIQEVARLRDDLKATLIVIDAKLSGIQTRNIQDLVGCKVIDRHQLILDIFAQRAQTREGKLQVELAQLKDQLPRLIGEAVAGLSKLAGGIGTRGPGETKLEMDRRRVRTRIEHLTKDLENVRKSRELHRKRRRSSLVPVLALAGYTNAGKSTLLNRLTHSDVYVENKLFATLDPTTRKLRLPSGKTVVLSDTVGFINNLPHHLIEAFKATFEEIAEADIIIQVHDTSHPQAREHAQTVTKLLEEVGAKDKPVIHAYNKIDQSINPLAQRLNPFVQISAATGEGLPQLLELVDQKLASMTKIVDLYLPTEESSLTFKLARDGKIISQTTGDHVIHCKVQLTDEALQRWSKYLYA